MMVTEQQKHITTIVVNIDVVGAGLVIMMERRPVKYVISEDGVVVAGVGCKNSPLTPAALARLIGRLLDDQLVCLRVVATHDS